MANSAAQYLGPTLLRLNFAPDRLIVDQMYKAFRSVMIERRMHLATERAGGRDKDFSDGKAFQSTGIDAKYSVIDLEMAIRIFEDELLCIERECMRCGQTYLISLSHADFVPPDSIVNLCSRCMTAVFVDCADYEAMDEYFNS